MPLLLLHVSTTTSTTTTTISTTATITYSATTVMDNTSLFILVWHRDIKQQFLHLKKVPNDLTD